MYIISTSKGRCVLLSCINSNVPLNDFHNENNIMYTQFVANEKFGFFIYLLIDIYKSQYL